MICKFFHKFNKIIVYLLISAFFLTSCTSYKIVNKDEMTPSIIIKGGDKIRVTKSDGNILRLIYVDITDEILITKSAYSSRGYMIYSDKTIPLDQITKIEKSQVNKLRTVLLISVFGYIGFYVFINTFDFNVFPVQ